MLIYFLVIMESLGDTLNGIVVISSVGVTIGLIMAFAYSVERNEQFKIPSFCKFGAITAAILAIIASLLPTNKQLAMIVAGNWVVNSEDIRELPDNVAKTLNQFLDSYVEELDKEVVEELKKSLDSI
jgi:hypothetical protein